MYVCVYIYVNVNMCMYIYRYYWIQVQIHHEMDRGYLLRRALRHNFLSSHITCNSVPGSLEADAQDKSSIVGGNMSCVLQASDPTTQGPSLCLTC